jgi:hypothetical protein
MQKDRSIFFSNVTASVLPRYRNGVTAVQIDGYSVAETMPTVTDIVSGKTNNHSIAATAFSIYPIILVHAIKKILDISVC